MTTVVAAIIERDGRLLIGQRRADQEHPLKWEFPGGKVEGGEGERDALARELREELRIQAAIGPEVDRYQYAYGTNPPIELVFFKITKFCGTPDNRIFAQTRWTAPGDLRHYDFLEGDGAIVALLSGSPPTKTEGSDPGSDAS